LSWGKAQNNAAVTAAKFHDLRGMAVTRLALVGCTEAQNESIASHSSQDAGEILDAHYLGVIPS